MDITINGTVRYTPSAKQEVFHLCPSRYVLYGGAAGGGSRSGAVSSPGRSVAGPLQPLGPPRQSAARTSEIWSGKGRPGTSGEFIARPLEGERAASVP